MKRLIISLAIIITGFCAFSQQMEFDWITQAGGPGWDIVTDINELPDGNLAVVGTFYESINFPNDTLYSEGSRDIFIAKYAPDGSLQQLTSIGGQGYDYVKTMEIFGENAVILPIKFYQDLEISGKTFESKLSNNFLISWFDQNLALTHSFLLGSTKEFDISGLQAEPDGGCLFTGWFSDTLMVENIVYEAKAEKDIFVGKLNANGGLLWLKHFQGEGNDIATNIISTPENVSLLIGTTTKGCFDVENNPKFKGDKYTHIFLVELDSLGNSQTISYPFSSVEIEPVDALVDSNSVLFLANIKNPVYTARNEKISPIENSDILLIKVDRNSQETEYFLLGGTSNDLADGLIKSGENLLVTGLFNGSLLFDKETLETKNSGSDVFIAAFDSNCNPKDIFILTGESSEFPCSAFASKTGVYVTGEFRNEIIIRNEELVSAGKEDIFLARVENCNAKNPLHIEAILIDEDNINAGWELDAGADFVEYSWEDNSSNSRYFTTNTPGKYSLTVTDFFGCKYSGEIELTPEKSASTIEDLGANDFKLYPTITSDFVNWQPASEWLNSNAVVKVFDSSGRMVKNSEVKLISAQSYTINLSSQTEGIYMVEISGDNFHQVGKVVVKK